eukprot:COSAG01_NODE_123_length_25210_cov_348.799434_21_plen_132_part_00
MSCGLSCHHQQAIQHLSRSSADLLAIQTLHACIMPCRVRCRHHTSITLQAAHIHLHGCGMCGRGPARPDVRDVLIDVGFAERAQTNRIVVLSAQTGGVFVIKAATATSHGSWQWVANCWGNLSRKIYMIDQ